MTTAEAIVIAATIISAAWVWTNERGACLLMNKERLAWKLKREHDEWDHKMQDERAWWRKDKTP